MDLTSVRPRMRSSALRRLSPVLALAVAFVGVSIAAPQAGAVTAPGNDAISSATGLTVPAATSGQFPVSNVGATRDGDDPSFDYGALGDGSDADSSPCYGDATTWYRLTVPGAGRLTLQLYGLSAGFDGQFVVFKSAVSSVSAASISQVAAGAPATNLRVGNTSSNVIQSIEIDTVGTGGPYVVGLAGCDQFAAGDTGAGVTGTAVLATSFVARPPSDLFASATALAPTQTADIRGAATAAETDEPSYSGSGASASCNGASSIWYSTTPGTGHLRIRTSAESFDGVVALFDGATTAGLGAIDSHDRVSRVGQGNGHADLSVDTVAGRKYWVRVAHCDPDPYRDIIPLSELGTLTLLSTFTPAPPNDAFASATVLTGTSGTVTGDTTGATAQTDETDGPANVGNDVRKSVWFSWRIPTSGTYVVDTHGSSYNTNLSIGTRASSLAAQSYDIGTNDDRSATDVTSRLQFTRGAGQIIAIRVSGVDDGTHPFAGPLTLHWAPAPDTIAPTVRIVSPSTGSRIAKARVLRVSTRALDNKNQVAKVTISVSGLGSQDVLTGSAGGVYTATFDPSAQPNNTVLTITARAQDRSGNLSSIATSRVTVDDGRIPSGFVGSTRGIVAAGHCVCVTGAGGSKKVSASTGPAWQATRKGATMTIRFVGDRINLYLLENAKSGKATVTLDGKSITINLGSAHAKTLLKSFAGLAPVQHRLVIRSLGVRGSHSSGVGVQLNRVRVYDPN